MEKVIKETWYTDVRKSEGHLMELKNSLRCRYMKEEETPNRARRLLV